MEKNTNWLVGVFLIIIVAHTYYRSDARLGRSQEERPADYVAEVDNLEIPPKTPLRRDHPSRLDSVFKAQVGVREVGNSNTGVEVNKYLKSVGLGPGYPWCAAVMSWGLKEVGIAGPNTAWSPSFFPKKNTIYTRGVNDFPFAPDHMFVGFYYNNLGRIGHVGYLYKVMGGSVKTMEGNTNGDGSREGSGFHYRVRPKSSIYKISQWK